MNYRMKLAMEKGKKIGCIILCVIFLFQIGRAQSYPEKPEPAVYTNDYAEILSPSQETELEQMLAAYFDSTSTQIVLVTVKSLEGADASQYAVELAESWGIGGKEKDNGVLFLVAPNERKMFIASGRGTEEKLTDIFLGRIRDNYILPEFKNGNFYGGIRAGILQMMNRLNGSFVADSVEVHDEVSLGQLILVLIILFVLFSLITRAVKNANYSETYSGRGYRGGGFWGTGGGSSWGGGGSWGGGSSGGSFGGGSFGGGGAGGSW